MNIYNALIKKNDNGKVEDIIMIKEGFSWKAFFFNTIWFVYHRMWKEIIILFLIGFAFSFFAKLSSDFDKLTMQIALFFMVALNANYWLCEKIKNKGYEFAGIVFGSNATHAKLRFVKRMQNNELDEEQFGDAFLDPKKYYQSKKKRLKK